MRPTLWVATSIWTERRAWGPGHGGHRLLLGDRWLTFLVSHCCIGALLKQRDYDSDSSDVAQATIERDLAHLVFDAGGM